MGGRQTFVGDACVASEAEFCEVEIVAGISVVRFGVAVTTEPPDQPEVVVNISLQGASKTEWRTVCEVDRPSYHQSSEVLQ